MVIEPELSIWPMAYFPSIIVNLDTAYRELTPSFLRTSRADSITWALGVIFWTVYDGCFSATSANISVLFPGFADGFGSAYSKSILVLLSLGLDSIE
jgi:hypothetical protein